MFRVTVKDLNITVSHNPGQRTISAGEGTADWIIRETNVPGQY